MIGFPAGTKIDQSVKPYCAKLDESANDVCPKNTQIGSGTAEVRLKFPGSAPIPAKVTAYNRKKGLWLYVVPQVSGQAPVVIKPTFQGLKLVTVLTPLCVLNDCATNGEAVLTKFHLDTKAYSKTTKKKKGKKTVKKTSNFITAPEDVPRGRLEVHGRLHVRRRHDQAPRVGGDVQEVASRIG